MDISLLGSSFALLFLAEVGDKTQLMAMTLAHRYRAAPVIAGTLAAFALLNLAAVLVGGALFEYVPRDAVLLVAGTLFIYFGWRSWQDGQDEEDASVERARGGAFLTSFLMILLAELGDKTQLAMIALAAGSGDIWAVFVGGTLALWAVSLIGIALGATLLRRLPGHWMHRAAAVLFVGFGLVALGRVGYGLVAG